MELRLFCIKPSICPCVSSSVMPVMFLALVHLYACLPFIRLTSNLVYLSIMVLLWLHWHLVMLCRILSTFLLSEYSEWKLKAFTDLWRCFRTVQPCLYNFYCLLSIKTLHWRHNDHDGVSNHQPHDCLLNCLYRRRSKETSKLRVTGLCVGNSPGPVNSPHKGPVTRKMFPFDDVIMNHWWNVYDIGCIMQLMYWMVGIVI